MASHAMKLIEAETRNRIAAANRRHRTQALEHTLVRKGVGAVSAAIFGTMLRMGVPNALGGFPWKVAIIALAQLAEGLSKGAVQAAMGGLADATTAIYIDRGIAGNSWIAGGEVAPDTGGELE